MKISEIITVEKMFSGKGPASYSTLAEKYGTQIATQFLEAQIFAEAHNTTIKENTNPDLIKKLNQFHCDDPETGKVYYGIHLGVMGDTIQNFGNFRGKLIDKRSHSTRSVPSLPGMVDGDLKSTEYLVKLSDGTVETYPQVISNNVHMRVLFFSDQQDYRMACAELKLSHDVDFKTIVETTAGGIAAVVMPMGKHHRRKKSSHTNQVEDTLHGNEFHQRYGEIPLDLEEAEYQGRKVTLNKPMRGDVKKFKVYVKDGDKVKKVNFGDPDMKIKKSNPERRRSFRARHNCDNPGPKTKARYWSCRKW